MNYPRSLQVLSKNRGIAFTLIISLLLWLSGFPLSLQFASAATVAQFSATASSSVPSANTNYRITWTDSTQITVGQTIKITFDPGNSTFDLGSLANNEVVTSASPTNLSIITTACGATPNQVSISGGISNSAGDKSVTLTACGTIATGTKSVTFTNNHVTNPSSPGSYKIIVGGTQADSGQTLVAIINQVTVSASVATSLSFNITGLSSGSTVNGETTSTSTSASAIAFGTLASGTPIIGGQELTVTTNAGNGFVVTVQEDQNLTSSAGSQIYTFKDGGGTSLPIAWASPTSIVGNALTYGHIGLTSDDSDLNAGEFTGTKYVGNFATTSRVIFSNSGAADGVTQNIGKARVAYKIQISALQAAASDYSNHFTYICTATF